MIEAWTDYPFTELGDRPFEEAPIRQIRIISYDGDKYVNGTINGIDVSIKLGYCYRTRGRLGEVVSYRFDDPEIIQLFRSSDLLYKE